MTVTASSRSAARTTIALCVMAAFCEGIDLQAAGVANLGITAEFSPAAGQPGNFLSASTLGLFIGALIGGRLADSIGRRTVLIVSIALFGLFSLLTAGAWDFTSLTWARLLTGLGLGGAFPMLVTLVSESSAEHRRTANVALAYAGTPIGGALISLVTLLIAPGHWRWIFIIGGGVPLLVAALMIARLSESPEYVQMQAAASTSGPGGAVAMKAGNFMAILAGGRATRTILLWVSFFLGLLTLYLLLNWLPTLMVESGLTRPQAAGAQIGFNIGGAVAALGMGRLLGGKFRNVSLLVAFIALPVLLWVLANTGANFASAVTVVFLLGCAVLAAQAFLYATAPAIYPTWIRGVGVGAAIAMGRIGSIIGPKFGGVLKELGHNSSQLLMDLLPIAALGSLCALALAWYKPKR